MERPESRHPARLVPVPRQVLRGVVAATWNLGLQPLDPGWLDLAFSVPLLLSDRARGELGWTPTVDFKQLIEMMVDADLARLRSKDATRQNVTA